MKDKILSFWENTRLRSAFFLLLWIIFIVVVVVKFAIPYSEILNNANDSEINNEGEVVPEDEEIIYDDMRNSLLRYNFDYIYTITMPEETIIYKGTMMGNETTGYKESVLGIEKYYVKGTQIYQIVLGEHILLTDKSVDVYSGYLSVDKIMDLTKDVTYTENGNELNYEINGIYVKIILGEYNIEKIEINDDNINYSLEFSNINEITELNY